jgi:hypothetical protein
MSFSFLQKKVGKVAFGQVLVFGHRVHGRAMEIQALILPERTQPDFSNTSEASPVYLV